MIPNWIDTFIYDYSMASYISTEDVKVLVGKIHKKCLAECDKHLDEKDRVFCKEAVLRAFGENQDDNN